jgi:hypothetical protein
MEQKVIKFIPLIKSSDEIFKISYLTILSEETLDSIKLPTNFDNYKYSHLIKPNYLLTGEIIKTRKNWILKSILSYEAFHQPISYSDFLKQSEICKIILKHIHQGELTNILEFLLKTFQNKPIRELDTKNFEQNLTKSLGFI